MRRVLHATFGVSVLAATLALVHCSASEREGIDAASDGGTGDATTFDAAPASEDAASVADAGDGKAPPDAGHCSPDHWCRVPLPEKSFDVSAVWSFGPNDAIAVGANGMIHWDGKAWSIVDAGDGGVAALTSLWASGPDDVWGVAQGRRLLAHGTRAADGGLAWSVSEPEDGGGPTRDLVVGFGTSDLWVAGINADDGTPVLEHGVRSDGGAPAFSRVELGVPVFSIGGLYAASHDRLYVAGSSADAVVLQADRADGGFAWAESLAKSQNFFPTVTGVGASDVWTVGTSGESFHGVPAADGGVAWTQVPSHSSVALAQVWGTAPNDVWAVGYFGAIRHWDGSSWSVSQIAVNGTPIYETLLAVHGSSANDVWAMGPGVALHREIGGGGQP